MRAPTQEQMHREHRTWRGEDLAWLDDLGTWRSQAGRALAAVARLEAMVRDHEVELVEHEGTIRRFEQHLARHEREIGALQEAGADEQYDPLTPSHEDCLLRRIEAEKLHERLKVRHRRLISILRPLTDAVATLGEG